MNLLENKTDEELAALSQQGDRKAEEVLIERNKNLVKKITRSYFLIGGDGDDLIQEGMIGLIQAVHAYNGKSSFKTFAGICIKRKVDTAIKKSNRGKNKPLNDYVSFSDKNNNSELKLMLDRTAVSPETEYINKEEEVEFIEAVKNALSPLEGEILEWYLEGLNYQAIGEKIGKNPKSVDNALRRIRNKILKITEG